MDLRFSTLFEESATCDALPDVDDLGIPQARLIAPGEPSRSIVLQRMSRADTHQMPPVGIRMPDPLGAYLMTEWISSLKQCP